MPQRMNGHHNGNRREEYVNYLSQTAEERRNRKPFLVGATNVTFQQSTVSRDERASALGKYDGFRGCTVWFTGLCAAGKSTLSFALEKALVKCGIPTYVLDGDNMRHGLCKDLGFKSFERVENLRRVAEVSKLFADTGIVSLASFISPFESDRRDAREIHKKDGLKFFEVHLSTPLDVCEVRDEKNLYQRARNGEIQGFTGIDSTYEVPSNPDLTLNTAELSKPECLHRLLHFLHEKGIIPETVVTQYNVSVCEEFFTEDAANTA
ncbi:3'-phosphoadenosine 5'-phosphosulfate synthase 2 [Aphelenchoides avenae]|nr:3'-phosphoadenosine 5'-phosphosulfate synthase 2 [Aphelenchus avenae]